MKITFLDLYPDKKFKISKNTNSGLGTGNNYGNSLFAKLQNKLVKYGIHYPPQCCLYSMSVLKHQGHEIIYSDKLIENGSDLYIFTSSMVCHETEIKSISKLREKTDSYFLIIGPFLDHLHKPYIDADKKFLTKVILGEPEGFFYNNPDFFSQLDNFAEKIIYNELVNLDDLPYPSWDVVFKNSDKPKMVFMGKNNVSITLETSRGCPYSCSFYCSYPNIQGKKMRFRDPYKVIEEMLYHYKTIDARNFTIRDPVFSISKKHCNLILEEVAKINKPFNLCVETHLKDIDDETIQLMKKARVKLIYVGVESSDTEVLQSAKRKNISNLEIFQKVKKLEAAGIMVKCNYILCLPADNYKTSINTIKFAKKLNSSFAQFTVFTPMPRTPAWHDYEKKFTFKKYEQMTMWDLIFKHENINYEQLEELKNKAAQYYFSPKYLVTRMPRVLYSIVNN